MSYINNIISTFYASCLTISPSPSLLIKLAAVLVCSMTCVVIYSVPDAPLGLLLKSLALKLSLSPADALLALS